MEVHRQSGGFSPWNSYSACLAARSDCIGEDRLDLLNQGDVIPPGLAPWNLYPARNVDTNSHIEVECFNLLKPDGAIPLGLCHSRKRFSQKLHQLSVGGAFLWLFW